MRETLLSDIKEFGLQGIFSEINSDVHDKAEDIQETIRRNGFNPEEAIFIGDTAHEVDAGRSKKSNPEKSCRSRTSTVFHSLKMGKNGVMYFLGLMQV